jgi:hypothetical protein
MVIKGFKISVGVNLKLLSLLTPLGIERKIGRKKTARQHDVYTNRGHSEFTFTALLLYQPEL